MREMDEPIIIPCPICGYEDEASGIELHGPRNWGSGKQLPAGESFSCADDVGCGFYVEVNRQGVLKDLFSCSSGYVFRCKSTINDIKKDNEP